MARRRTSPSHTTKGEATRQRLFEIAATRFREEGYEQASLRKIAAEAGVTPALLYRYFDSKEAIAEELYDSLLDRWAERARDLLDGTWIERTIWLTEQTIEILTPYHSMLATIVGSMVSGDPATSPLRKPEVLAVAQPIFLEAVRGATDAPRTARRGAFAEMAYLGHLGLLLFWVLDRSPGQKASAELIQEAAGLAPFLKMGLKTPVVSGRILGVMASISATLRGEWDG